MCSSDLRREIFSIDPNKQNLSGCIKIADFMLNNDGTLDDLYKQIEEIYEKICSNTTSQVTKREDYIYWDEYFMGVAMLSAMRSKDPNSQIGACIINEKNHIVATGYNGFPIGCSDDNLPWAREGDKLDTKYIYVVHAEANAITNSTVSLNGCKIYLALYPCNECAKLIIQSGIKEVIYMSDKYAHLDEYVASKKMLSMAGVRTRQFFPKNKTLLIDFEKINR